MDARSLFESVDRWAALRTAARWEKSIVEQLRQAGVPAYLPLMTRVSRSKSKTQSAEVPVFAGYVFCDELAFLDSRRVSPACRQKVAQVLRAPDPDRLRDELTTIAGVLTDRRMIQERFYGKVGETVRIVGGPLTGHLGEVLRLKPGSSRIVLEVSFLGTRVEATVEEHLLEKAAASKS